MTAEVIQTRALTVSDLMQDITQVNDEALASCALVLISTITNHLEYIGDNQDNLIAINAALSGILAKGSSLPKKLFDEISNCLVLTSSKSQSNMVVGEPAIALIDSNLRISSTVASVSDLQDLSFSSPLSLYETVNGIKAPTAQLYTNSALDGIFGVTIAQYTNNPLGGYSNASIVGIQTNFYQESYLTGRRLSTVSYTLTVKIPIASPLVLRSLEV